MDPDDSVSEADLGTVITGPVVDSNLIEGVYSTKENV